MVSNLQKRQKKQQQKKQKKRKINKLKKANKTAPDTIANFTHISLDSFNIPQDMKEKTQSLLDSNPSFFPLQVDTAKGSYKVIAHLFNNSKKQTTLTTEFISMGESMGDFANEFNSQAKIDSLGKEATIFLLLSLAHNGRDRAGN